MLASPAAALEKEPAGLGKAKLGMSPKEVQKLYPGKVRVLDMEHLGATPVKSAHMVRQLLSDQKVEGLASPTNVELRYWDDKLWVIIVYYGENSNESVQEGLRKVYGQPDLSGNDAVWRGKKVQINTATRERWYAIADLALSAQAQQAFAAEMEKVQAKMRESQKPPPAAPAAPTAPGH